MVIYIWFSVISVIVGPFLSVLIILLMFSHLIDEIGCSLPIDTQLPRSNFTAKLVCDRFCLSLDNKIQFFFERFGACLAIFLKEQFLNI